MKEDMMVVGITAVDEEIMKLELVPLITTKKRVNILDVAMGGNSNAIMKAIKGEQQHRTILYRTKDWVFKNQILPFCSMTLDLDTGDDHKKRIQTT